MSKLSSGQGECSSAISVDFFPPEVRKLGSKSEKAWETYKCLKKKFSTKSSPKHVECVFDKSAWIFLSKIRNSSSPKERQPETNFWKNPLKNSFGHTQSSFHNPANKSTAKLLELFCSEFKKNLRKNCFSKNKNFPHEDPPNTLISIWKDQRIFCCIKAEKCSESPIKFNQLLFQKKTLSCKIILWAGKMQFR